MSQEGMLDIVAERRTEEIQLIRLAGRLDSRTAVGFEEYCRRTIEEGRGFLILEASELEFVSSSGIAALIRLIRRLEHEGGQAAFAGLNDEIGMLFDFFGLGEKLPHFAGLDRATAYLQEVRRRKKPALQMRETSPALRRGSDGEPSVLRRHRGKTGDSKTDRRPEGVVRADDEPESLSTGRELEVGAQPVSAMDRREFRSLIREIIQEESTGESSVFRRAAGSGREGIPEKFAAPLIITCEQCSTAMRVYQTGLHLCPNCKIRLRIRTDGSAMYFEKL